jgi:hypothetical protein
MKNLKYYAIKTTALFPLAASFFAVAAVVLVGCANAQNIGSFTDPRDGKTYRMVKIGDQTWMAENLNYQTPDSSWGHNSWCYGNDTSNCVKYGRMYTWDAL